MSTLKRLISKYPRQYWEGREAQKDGVDLFDCPYDHYFDSNSYAAWRAGFRFQQAHSRKVAQIYDN